MQLQLTMTLNRQFTDDFQILAGADHWDPTKIK